MQKFKFLYCDNAFEDNEADPVYDSEYRVSREKGFEDCTAKSAWTEDFSEESLKELLSKFEGAVIVKDYVKSRKHEWYEACFIEDVKDTENALKVINNFIERQDDLLTGGIVLRDKIYWKT